MVKSRYIGDGHPTFDRNPYNGYINPYYWVDDHPLLYGNNGSLDPGTNAIEHSVYIIFYCTQKRHPSKPQTFGKHGSFEKDTTRFGGSFNWRHTHIHFQIQFCVLFKNQLHQELRMRKTCPHSQS